MDPLVDRWRAHFYPRIEDWSAYDSPAAAARPDAFETIAEIIAAAPRLAGWMNRSQELLDSLQQREFTDLDLPHGFGPDPESEAIARRGLARLYWTREFGVPEMMEQIADLPFLGVKEAVQTARDWSNDKVFQIGVHTIRGNLTPAEAGTALSNVAETSIVTVLSAVEQEFAGRGAERRARRNPTRGFSSTPRKRCWWATVSANACGILGWWRTPLPPPRAGSWTPASAGGSRPCTLPWNPTPPFEPSGLFRPGREGCGLP